MELRSKGVIAFDLGYTLLTNDRAKVHQQYLHHQGVNTDLDSIVLAYHIVDKEFMRSYPKVISTGGKQYYPWFVGRVNFELKHCFDLVEQTAFMLNIIASAPLWKPFPWAIEVLEQIKHKGYRLALLSNWDASARSILRSVGLDAFFEVILISSEVGYEKPDARIFHKLLSELRCTADEVVYVGDNYYDDVIGAQALGIDAVLVNPYGKIGIEELDFAPILPDVRSLLEHL
ncbi:MAG: (S)-2-haloacid dehalogenase 4A [Firmicutes bacterium]|nr:(S)-2-haloacid dehalogenase 4A [candidate division NPL-UPA2 bacterium]MBT9156647.1 (S)-2-haloacid dehalogenase 4A [candidate division NPL-UPA2 bacterium]